MCELRRREGRGVKNELNGEIRGDDDALIDNGI